MDADGYIESGPVGDTPAGGVSRRVRTWSELLVRLEEEYLVLLRESISFAVDEFGVKHGFISAADNTRLYLPEAKLRIIAREVGEEARKAGNSKVHIEEEIESWIAQSRDYFLKPVTPTSLQNTQAHSRVLEELCSEFKQTMTEGTIFYQKGGVMLPTMSASNKRKLSELARQIIEVGSLLGQTRYHWLVKTWTDFEKAHQRN